MVGPARHRGHGRGPAARVRAARRALADPPPERRRRLGRELRELQQARAGRAGASIPSQTAWALLGLFAVGTTSGPAVEAGVEYLLRTQRADGGWDDPFWNGTGFPRVFFLKYHLYAKYFPLWALGVYRKHRMHG